MMTGYGDIFFLSFFSRVVVCLLSYSPPLDKVSLSVAPMKRWSSKRGKKKREKRAGYDFQHFFSGGEGEEESEKEEGGGGRKRGKFDLMHSAGILSKIRSEIHKI